MMMRRTINELDLALLSAFASHVRPELEVESVKDGKSGFSIVVVDGFKGPDDLSDFRAKLESRTGVKL